MARKASPMARKAMRLKHSKGISLKEAWRRVRSGKSSKSRRSKKSRGGRSMAKRQGVASWLTSVAAWATAVGPPLAHAFDYVGRVDVFSNKLYQFGRGMLEAYTGYDFAANKWRPQNAVGVAGAVGGLVVKKAGSMLAKKAPIRTLIPKL